VAWLRTGPASGRAAAASNVVGQTSYPVNRGTVGMEGADIVERGTKSQRGEGSEMGEGTRGLI